MLSFSEKGVLPSLFSEAHGRPLDLSPVIGRAASAENGLQPIPGVSLDADLRL